MKTIKKKDIKKYKIQDAKPSNSDSEKELEEVEELEEFVTGTGGAISGDRNQTNNSEIETAPQATTDRFNQVAIQPNRYLFNVTGNAYSRGAHVNSESMTIVARDKMIKLLEDLTPETLNADNNYIDSNNNQVDDSQELPSSVVNKMDNLIKAVEMNKLSPDETYIILNYILTNLSGRLEDGHLDKLKNNF
tara:strand:+ start:2470 stop:3042 length:573 start_codon:yes stop_codon:yes gene_type:complete